MHGFDPLIKMDIIKKKLLMRRRRRRISIIMQMLEEESIDKLTRTEITHRINIRRQNFKPVKNVSSRYETVCKEEGVEKVRERRVPVPDLDGGAKRYKYLLTGSRNKTT